MYEEIVHTHLGMVGGRYCKKTHVHMLSQGHKNGNFMFAVRSILAGILI